MFKINPEKGRSVLLAKTHFLLLRILLLPLLKRQGKTSIKINKFSIQKKKKRDCIIISVGKQGTSLSVILCLLPLLVQAALGGNKCSAGFLRR